MASEANLTAAIIFRGSFWRSLPGAMLLARTAILRRQISQMRCGEFRRSLRSDDGRFSSQLLAATVSRDDLIRFPLLVGLVD